MSISGLCPNFVYNFQLCNIRFIIGITFFKVSIKLIEIFCLNTVGTMINKFSVSCTIPLGLELSWRAVWSS